MIQKALLIFAAFIFSVNALATGTGESEYVILRGVKADPTPYNPQRTSQYYAVVSVDPDTGKAHTLYEAETVSDLNMPVIEKASVDGTPLLFVYNSVLQKIEYYKPKAAKWGVMNVPYVKMLAAGPPGLLLISDSVNELYTVSATPPQRHLAPPQVTKLGDLNTVFDFNVNPSIVSKLYWIGTDLLTGEERFAIGVESTGQFTVVVFRHRKDGTLQKDAEISQEYGSDVDVGTLRDIYVTKNEKLWTAHTEAVWNNEERLYYQQWNLADGSLQHEKIIYRDQADWDTSVQILDWPTQNGPLIARNGKHRVEFDTVTNHLVELSEYYSPWELLRKGAGLQLSTGSYIEAMNESRHGHRVIGQKSTSTAVATAPSKPEPVAVSQSELQRKVEEVESLFSSLDQKAGYVGTARLYSKGSPVFTLGQFKAWWDGLDRAGLLPSKSSTHRGHILKHWIYEALKDKDLEKQLEGLGFEPYGSDALKPQHGITQVPVNKQALFEILAKAALKAQDEIRKHCAEDLTSPDFSPHIDPFESENWID